MLQNKCLNAGMIDAGIAFPQRAWPGAAHNRDCCVRKPFAQTLQEWDEHDDVAQAARFEHQNAANRFVGGASNWFEELRHGMQSRFQHLHHQASLPGHFLEQRGRSALGIYVNPVDTSILLEDSQLRR